MGGPLGRQNAEICIVYLTFSRCFTAIFEMFYRQPPHLRFQPPPSCCRKVAAPSYLSDKEQKAFLETAGIAPICKGHKEACILRIVSKKGPNVGRKFWVCARPNGKEGDLLAKCDTFSWA